MGGRNGRQIVRRSRRRSEELEDASHGQASVGGTMIQGSDLDGSLGIADLVRHRMPSMCSRANAPPSSGRYSMVLEHTCV